MKVIAINGSPRMEKGNTAMILTPFIQGVMDAGAEVELFYARRLKVKPCTCGEMQNFINRLCPLIEPFLENHEGRTRAKFHKQVKIRKIVLVSTGGWWEKANFETVVRITEELAKDASVEFAGAVLRPHAFLMKEKGKLTKDGEAVLNAVKRAGYELIKEGGMNKETLERISRPLISQEGTQAKIQQGEEMGSNV